MQADGFYCEKCFKRTIISTSNPDFAIWSNTSPRYYRHHFIVLAYKSINSEEPQKIFVRENTSCHKARHSIEMVKAKGHKDAEKASNHPLERPRSFASDRNLQELLEKIRPQQGSIDLEDKSGTIWNFEEIIGWGIQQ